LIRKIEYPWINKIFSIIGHGYIRGANANDNIGKFIITDYQGLIKTVYLTARRAGKPKIEALHRLIDWLNKDQNLNRAALGLLKSSCKSFNPS